MEAQFDVDLDTGMGEGEEPERRNCLTCVNCQDLCPPCHQRPCVWTPVGVRCFLAVWGRQVSIKEALENIQRSSNGGEVDCPGWEAR